MNNELSEQQTTDDEVLPEYDFSGGVRGKHYQAYRRGYQVIIHKIDGTTEIRDFALPEGVVVLDPDVRAYFSDSEAVNSHRREFVERESLAMPSTAIATVTKMMEVLPETVQNQVVEHLRDYIAEMQDEIQWDTLFKETQKQLIAAARRAREEIATGHAEPLDYDQ
jgi:hypothetical protein